MNWFKWIDIASFDLWHEQVKSFMGLPRYGENALTGETDTNAQPTDNYTEPVIQDDGVYALVDNEIAVQFPNSLGVLSDMPSSKKTII